MTCTRKTPVILLSALLVLFPVIASGQSLMMATTTSTDNTGLLDELAPKFKEDTGINLKWVAAGTGKALEIARNCDVAILLVHAPEAEEKFISNGYGTDRKQVMYNGFVLIGPPGDPAEIKGLAIEAALRKLSAENAVFMSRGDESGTHKKELSLWERAGIRVPEKENWYLETGQGMIGTIRMAEERDGYTLTDRGTYIKYAHVRRGDPGLKILVEKDPDLFNQYSVIAVNPDRCKDAEYDRAETFIDWITSEQIQKFIGNFKLLEKQLFIPNAGK